MLIGQIMIQGHLFPFVVEDQTAEIRWSPRGNPPIWTRTKIIEEQFHWLLQTRGQEGVIVAILATTTTNDVVPRPAIAASGPQEGSSSATPISASPI